MGVTGQKEEKKEKVEEEEKKFLHTGQTDGRANQR